jgi:hypothetical protein
MPVYLCLAGAESDEPWKHGIQVFAKPFAVPEPVTTTTTPTTTTSPLPLDRTVGTSEPIHLVQQQQHHGMTHQDLAATTAIAAAGNNHSIRKVMHAQVVLADDVCIAYGRYWVRLRWPGSKGGFAGYIAMHKIPGSPPNDDGLPAATAAAATDVDEKEDHPNQQMCKRFLSF